VRTIKKIILLLVNLLLLSTFFWGVSVADGGEGTFKISTDTSTPYGHMKFPSLRQDTLACDQPMVEEGTGNVIAFYGPCDHDPMKQGESNAQRRALLRNYGGDGE
jgi:hypothetical protein